MKSLLITSLLALVSISSLSMDDIRLIGLTESLIDKTIELKDDVYDQSAKLKAGPKKGNFGGGRERITSKDKREVYTNLKGISRRLKQLRKEVESHQSNDEQLSPEYIKDYLSEISIRLKEVFSYIGEDHFNFTTTELSNEVLSSFRGLENFVADSLVDYMKEESLEDLIKIRRGEIKFDSGIDVCHSLSNPGDIILRKAELTGGTTDDDFGPKVMGYINLLEKIKGNGDKSLRYRHAEIITNMKSSMNIETTSYFPFLFNVGKEEHKKKPMFLIVNNDSNSKFLKYFSYGEYRNHFTAFRVKGGSSWGEIRKKELALLKTSAKAVYPRTGTCADFVSWTYMNGISSNWNRIPIVKNLINTLYVPEAISTPDNIADSYMTEKVCELDRGKLIFPLEVKVRPWVKRMKTASKSVSKRIREHAEKVLDAMVEKGILDQEGNRVLDIITLKTEQEEFVESFFEDFDW